MSEGRFTGNGTAEELERFGYTETLKRDFTLWPVFAFIYPVVALCAIFGLAFGRESRVLVGIPR